MVVGGQGTTEAQLAHDDETRAVGEGETLVRPREEPRARLLEPDRIDPLSTEAAAGVDLVPPGLRRVSAQTLRAYESDLAQFGAYLSDEHVSGPPPGPEGIDALAVRWTFFSDQSGKLRRS